MTQTDLAPLEILYELGVKGTPTVTPVPGGFDMAMWKVECEDQVYALRVFQPRAYEDWKQEQIVMSAARAAGLPVPDVSATGIWRNRPALLLTWLSGRTVAEELHERPWQAWHMGIAFGRMQAAIHVVPAPAPLRQRSDEWIAWKCAGEQTLQDHLQHLSSDKVALLHLDYHPRNVLTDGKQITGVLDWTNAHAGDPRADAARTVSILFADPVARNPFFLRIVLRVFVLAWRVGYQRAGGCLKDMPLFYAWAGTVIQQDLADRYAHKPQELYPARRWTDKWKEHAGILTSEK